MRANFWLWSANSWLMALLTVGRVSRIVSR